MSLLSDDERDLVHNTIIHNGQNDSKLLPDLFVIVLLYYDHIWKKNNIMVCPRILGRFVDCLLTALLCAVCVCVSESMSIITVSVIQWLCLWYRLDHPNYQSNQPFLFFF